MATDDSVSLREFLETKILGVKESLTAALRANETAILKSEAATEERFRSVNEFRATLADSARLFMPRAEYEQAHKALEQKVETLERTLSGRVESVATRVSSREDRGRGMGEIWGYLIGVAGIITAIIAIAISVLKRS